MIDVISEVHVKKTRKDHVCNACLRTFVKGCSMHVQTCTDGNDMYQWRMCETCEELIRVFPDRLDSGEGFAEGCVSDCCDVDFDFKLTPEQLLEYAYVEGITKFTTI